MRTMRVNRGTIVGSGLIVADSQHSGMPKREAVRQFSGISVWKMGMRMLRLRNMFDTRVENARDV
jgi:hypothetical protein